MSCAIGLILLISENEKIHKFGVTSHQNQIYQGNQLIELDPHFLSYLSFELCNVI